ncbi:Uncharacterised protein [Achromobacter xylosoxidans]|nr:hypothetical protein [Achromobacter xylosoxidans]CUI93821.1 Uncharacterised protein [Achromobacter xylosoxidans]
MTQRDPASEIATLAVSLRWASTVANWFETVPLLKMLSSPGPPPPTNRLSVRAQVEPGLNTLTRAVAPGTTPASIRPCAVPRMLRTTRDPPETVVLPAKRELSPCNCVEPA